ncbi:venom allergen 5 isoform X2 [Cimex lectularius]|uniref:SCP domain-containing protein n=1 Tax=Cimex lectularius TaxID=79782 RepID=A0A8I6R957_CIMLE|nr:venom allergen 5 isoform X2 [Cimex lectularius]
MAKLVTCVIFLSLVNVIRACVNGTLLSSYTLTCQDKKDIVNWHNHYRQRVATTIPTENMRKLYWDHELETQAQKLASSCLYEHDSPTIQGKNDVGQTIWQTITTNRESSSKGTMKFKEQIDEWYKEGLKYKGATTEDVRHFTQLVWADSYKVGCGFSYFKKKDKNGKDEHYIKYYVCNYAPKGNKPTESPYRRGNGCNHHHLTPTQDTQGLCNF